MKRLVPAAVLLLPALALAQSSPGFIGVTTNPSAPALTAVALNAAFAAKTDYPPPILSVAGRTGAITLNHSDITDWTSALAASGLAYTLPVAGASLGGVLGTACGSGQFVDAVNTSTGALTCATPSNGYTLPVAGASLGGVLANAGSAGQFVSGINTSTGALIYATPSGSGNVSGPGSSTSGYVPQWSGTGGTSLSAGLPVGTSGNSTILETGSGGTIAASVLPTVTGSICYAWDSNTTVAAGTLEVPIPWTSGTITAVHAATNGSGTPSFSIAVAIGGTAVTGCSAVTVSSASDTATSCTAANTVSAGSQVTIAASSVSGTPQKAYACVTVTHSVN